MSENNKSYRIKANINSETNVNVQLSQDYDNFEILSLNISRDNVYRMHTADYGCIAGRVLANGAYGIPNAKICVFIPTTESDEIDPILKSLYPYETTIDKDGDKIRFNTLPDEKIDKCHQEVGTFPNKRLVLDDNNILEIFDKYYKYTAVSNEAGDFMLFGVPVGQQTVHLDVDLSDIGDLSQTPIDMMYKGYNADQFESPTMFKKDSEIDLLPQIISQDSYIYVNPFWGDDTSGTISITRCDIDLKYKFEPTCIFLGSLITDGQDNGVSQNCVPTHDMGKMSQLKGGSGTIEMIRKTPDDNVESYVIKGTKLIDGNGTWCYQIPMNLDYLGTDEYGNKVATNDPNKGVPTRTRVRFRVSLTDGGTEYTNNHLAKVLIPNNPENMGETDYSFGSYSLDNDEGSQSFRDLFSNDVYTVKSFIPRIQKSNAQRNKHFSGFKDITVNNGNAHLPYNNMRVEMSFMFILQCAILKVIISIVRLINKYKIFSNTCTVVGDGVCPDLEGWYFAPGCNSNKLQKTIDDILTKDNKDKQSTDSKNAPNSDDENVCITSKLDYLIQCVEINLAMEYNVIKFDFYNDWINGMIYMPHWYGNIRRKRSYLFGTIKRPERVQACMEDVYFKSRRYVQQCALSYRKDEDGLYTKVSTKLGCQDNQHQRCHRGYGRKTVKVFGSNNGGLIHNEETLKKEHVYYFKPCEWIDTETRYPKKAIMFATDIVMLGSVKDYNKDGVPTAFYDIPTTSYKMPGNLVSTNLETDGPLYGMDSGSICSGHGQSEVKKTNDYSTYSQVTSDFVDDSDDNEYKLSEMSGIDWGYSGPGQGENVLKDLYFPGGHFLGISCLYPETNIKSCVNLSRACEAGAMLSQYQSIVKGINNGKAEYMRIIPNGLISRYEIDDTNFRNIFSSLNYNGLKTKVNNETNHREYDLISNISLNFDGVLTGNVDNVSYNDLGEVETFNGTGEKATVVKAALEYVSKEYYLFRLGLKNDDLKNDNFIRSRYLINDGNDVSLPMYRNSFYFYFGIKEGMTAYDRFLNGFFAICPDENADSPTITVSNIIDTELCTENDGCATVTLDDIGSAYSLELYKQDNTGKYEILNTYWLTDDNAVYLIPDDATNPHGDGKQTQETVLNSFIIGQCRTKKGLYNGDYLIRIVRYIDNTEYQKTFKINTGTPDILVDVINGISIIDFNKDVDTGICRDVNNLNYDGYLKIHINDEYKDRIKSIIISNSGDDIIKYPIGGEDGIYGPDGLDPNGNGYVNGDDFYVPSGNTSYSIRYAILCENETVKEYAIEDGYFIGMPTRFDYYFSHPSALKRYILKAINDSLSDSDKISNLSSEDWYKQQGLQDNLNPERLWYLEKTLVYSNSLFDLKNKDLTVIPYGGVLPYTERVEGGHGEMIKDDETYDTIYQVSLNNTNNSTAVNSYSVDHHNFIFATEYYGEGADDTSFKIYREKAQNLGLISNTTDSSKLMKYKLTLKDANGDE